MNHLPEGHQAGSEADGIAAECAQHIAEDLLRLMDVTGTVRVTRTVADDPTESAPLMVEMLGDDLQDLVGPKAEVLNALQLLLRALVAREIGAHANLLLDVGGYRAHRVEQLNRLALRMAEQAVEQQKVIKMEPLPAFERRLVHLALREFNGARTHSEGDGDLRRVVISPTT